MNLFFPYRSKLNILSMESDLHFGKNEIVYYGYCKSHINEDRVAYRLNDAFVTVYLSDDELNGLSKP